MTTDAIKQFYSRINFPGKYSWEDLKFYEEQGIHNVYLKEIDAIMVDGYDVLDVGCGTGLVSNLFAIHYPNSQLTAVDFSDSIDYAREFAKTNGIANVKWIKKDFLEFRTVKKYDLIICCGVLHHIPEYQQALAKLKGLLKPGGKLVLAVYNKYGKILKKFFEIKYNSHTLYHDQENNPFEMSFTNRQVLKMCNDLKFESVTPSFKNKFVDTLAWFNSENGGLALYVFTNPT
jgi:2-polyprenyl-3-methyl-5-hydroxy-6-metoxy-1,4-benzoquinol methylase